MHPLLNLIGCIMASASLAFAQVTVQIEKSPDGVYTYAYALRNDTSPFTISAVFLYLPGKVAPQVISPGEWNGKADEFIVEDDGRVLISDVTWESTNVSKGVLAGEMLTGFILKSKDPPRRAAVTVWYSKEGLAQHSHQLDTLGPSPLLVGDVDLDSDIDSDDVQLINRALNIPVKPGDPRDIDGDGRVTEFDARQCALKCTRAGCATAEANTNVRPVAK